MLKKFAKSYLRVLEVMLMLFLLYRIVKEAFILMNTSNDALNFAGVVVLTFGLVGVFYYIGWFIQRINKK